MTAAAIRVVHEPGSGSNSGRSVNPAEAEEFLRLFYTEQPSAQETGFHSRLDEVDRELARTGCYRHTEAELTFGARVAWRNSARCIGRLYWHSLRVRDRRGVTRPESIAAECVTHLREATRGGRIRSTITVFAPDTPDTAGPRIWNEQLVRYAAYPSSADSGTVLGDPRNLDITTFARRLGWCPPSPRTRFDLLPLVIEARPGELRWFSIPPDAVLEVPLRHPDLPWFADLGLRWHAVPAISCMKLVIGGVHYPAAPFNGWYMGTEIGARNLADADRYDMLPVIAARMGLRTDSERTLWRDRALVELTVAVHHSFTETGVTITDHHTESRRFLTHLGREETAGRSCPADWSWIVPPMSGSQTPVFHRYYDAPDDSLRPAFLPPDSPTAPAPR